jgi:carbamate kinase
MADAVVVLVNGEVLAGGTGTRIADQRQNARRLAEGLLPLFGSNLKIAIMHGNKPQVGYVLFRSELASHVLHTIPLDVCGADTQGATGYMLSQAAMNVLSMHGIQRPVACLLTQALVENTAPNAEVPLQAIGPWYDREKANQYRETRGWAMIEESGRGYRRGVPTYQAKAILEFDSIRALLDTNTIVIAGGGGGIPAAKNEDGELVGVEAVIETEQLASLMAFQLGAKVIFSVIESDEKFILSGLSTENLSHISVEELDSMLQREPSRSRSVQRILKSAAKFLHQGGEQVVITTLNKLDDTLHKQNGLWIGALESYQALFTDLQPQG